jgi:hypothetical protein
LTRAVPVTPGEAAAEATGTDRGSGGDEDSEPGSDEGVDTADLSFADSASFATTPLRDSASWGRRFWGRRIGGTTRRAASW